MSDLDFCDAEYISAHPLVSIGMPIYNAGQYLRMAVLSIINQTFSDWELLIIDDGSTDNAVSSISDLDDSRIKIVLDGENKGLAVRLNECIDLAKGRYFARMDQDDVSYPDRLMRQMTMLEETPELDLVAVRAITIDQNNKMSGIFPSALTHNDICARPWRGFYFPHPTWMGRIEWFRKHRYTIPAHYFCEDQELLIRSYDVSKFATVNEILFAYRVRNEINSVKLAKTRRAVLSAQLYHFFRLKKWWFSLLALLAFAGKTVVDFFRKVAPYSFQIEKKSLDDVKLQQWKAVLKGLVMESRTP